MHHFLSNLRVNNLQSIHALRFIFTISDRIPLTILLQHMQLKSSEARPGTGDAPAALDVLQRGGATASAGNRGPQRPTCSCGLSLPSSLCMERAASCHVTSAPQLITQNFGKKTPGLVPQERIPSHPGCGQEATLELDFQDSLYPYTCLPIFISTGSY